jgi:SpoVK/Ycf46/Vps4 family AAA+-type ATPase
MTLSEDVNLEEFVMAKDELSGADIKAVCTEAGLLALRERRMRVTQVCCCSDTAVCMFVMPCVLVYSSLCAPDAHHCWS